MYPCIIYVCAPRGASTRSVPGNYITNFLYTKTMISLGRPSLPEGFVARGLNVAENNNGLWYAGIAYTRGLLRCRLFVYNFIRIIKRIAARLVREKFNNKLQGYRGVHITFVWVGGAYNIYDGVRRRRNGKTSGESRSAYKRRPIL